MKNKKLLSMATLLCTLALTVSVAQAEDLELEDLDFSGEPVEGVEYDINLDQEGALSDDGTSAEGSEEAQVDFKADVPGTGETVEFSETAGETVGAGAEVEADLSADAEAEVATEDEEFTPVIENSEIPKPVVLTSSGTPSLILMFTSLAALAFAYRHRKRV